MGYDWLGRMPYKGSVENGAYKAQGVQLTAKLGYPITDDLDIYTRSCSGSSSGTGSTDQALHSEV